MVALDDELRPELLELLRRRALLHDEARPEAVARWHAAGRRTARENLADLLEADSFHEYGGFAIAAQRGRRPEAELITRTPADGIIGGLGRCNTDLVGAEAARCAALSYDYLVMAGTQGMTGHHKTDRLLGVIDELQLPTVLFAEGGGGRPGDIDHATVGGLDLSTFATWAGFSGRLPRIGIASGNCFAGNAALFGMCDITIATTGASIGMGGPAMIEGGGLGTITAADVGPLELQVKNGVVDIAVTDDAAAVAMARRCLAWFQGATGGWECADQTLLRDVVPQRRRRAYDVRKAVELIADTGSVIELRPRFGRSVVTALARLEGRPVGIIANNPLHMAGAITSDAADKAARFLQLCDGYGAPVVSLIDTPGIMVGPDAEATALVRHAARLFTAGAALRVPLSAVILRKGYGLGAMAMTGGSFHTSTSTVAWPTGEVGGMGLEGAVRLALRRELEAIDDPVQRRETFDAAVAYAYDRGAALSAATYAEIDDVIDPADTRNRLVASLSGPKPEPRCTHRVIDTW